MARSELAAQLDALNPLSTAVMKVDAIWGDQPDVLGSIKAARLRRCSYAQIAKALTGSGVTISADSIKRWLDANGVD